MEWGVWLAAAAFFVSGGLTPGPAVMLVTTSSLRYGFWPSMLCAAGICAANLVWVVLAALGASALTATFPEGFLALKLIGLGYIAYLAWQLSSHGTVDLSRRPAPPRGHLWVRGVTLQLANPNALVFFGGILPAYLDPHRSMALQSLIIMATVTVTELSGLIVYALAAAGLARRFASEAFARIFYRIAAALMAASATVGVATTTLMSPR